MTISLKWKFVVIPLRLLSRFVIREFPLTGNISVSILATCWQNLVKFHSALPIHSSQTKFRWSDFILKMLIL